MEIFSKRSGPRREDAQARSLIENNRGTIEMLADQFSGGSSAQRRARTATEPLVVSDLKAPRVNGAPRPFVRVSPDHRVVVDDEESQIHYLGEVRRIDGHWRFVLATKANGFFAVLDPEFAERLAVLDGAPMGGARTDEVLASEVSALLGYGPRRA